MSAAERTEGVPDWPWLRREAPLHIFPKLRYLDCREPTVTTISTDNATIEAVAGAVENCLLRAEHTGTKCFGITAVCGEGSETIVAFNGHLGYRRYSLPGAVAMALSMCVAGATAVTLWCGDARGVISVQGGVPGQLPGEISVSWTDRTCPVVRPLVDDAAGDPCPYLPGVPASQPRPHSWSQCVVPEAEALAKVVDWVEGECYAIEIVRDGAPPRVLMNSFYHYFECGMTWDDGHIPTAQFAFEQVERARWRRAAAHDAGLVFGPLGTVGGVRFYTGVAMAEYLRDADDVITESILWIGRRGADDNAAAV